jgi:hypothetical protein
MSKFLLITIVLSTAITSAFASVAQENACKETVRKAAAGFIRTIADFKSFPNGQVVAVDVQEDALAEHYSVNVEYGDISGTDTDSNTDLDITTEKTSEGCKILNISIENTN